jgi:holo-[acyl-carrier protein] synthase
MDSGGHVIAHGVDLVEIPRIEAMLLQHGQRFTGRCFTEAEQAYAEAGRRMRAQRYAARFACKEAVLKALGTGWRKGISWRDVEVRHDALGQPQVALSGRCAEIATLLGIDRWHLSLSHTPSNAMASVIASGRVSPGDKAS